MTRRIVSSDRQAANFIVELALLLADVFVNRSQRIDDRAKAMIFAHQLDNLVPKLQAERFSKQEPIFLDHAAGLVFDVPANANVP